MKDKHVLVTGGTGGLGLGVTPSVLASEAVSLTIPYTNARNVERLKSVLPVTDLDRIRFVTANLSNESAVENLVNDMERVDVLIHLVGGFSMGKTYEYPYEKWKADLELNLNLAFLVLKHSLRRMFQHSYGRIVTVGSRGAVQPGGQLAAYCAAKAGLIALTQAIADETKGTNITANIVLPSVIDTPTNRAAMNTENASGWVKPDSLAQVICFLASEAALDMRGAIVPVYGNL
ncbi:3-oxoacyl-ACP reductase FabG [Tolypothrix campylonemoides VB511288]|nr:3-oxoacyl-ACP reductase FabG [Tolypothrix campylonemoides VB511288]